MKIFIKKKKNGTHPKKFEEIFPKTVRTTPDEKGHFRSKKARRSASLRLHLFDDVVRKNGEKSQNAKGRSVG